MFSTKISLVSWMDCHLLVTHDIIYILFLAKCQLKPTRVRGKSTVKEKWSLFERVYRETGNNAGSFNQ